MAAQDALRDPSVSLLQHPQHVSSIPSVTLWPKMVTRAPSFLFIFQSFWKEQNKNKRVKKKRALHSWVNSHLIVYFSMARASKPYLTTRKLGNGIFIFGKNAPSSKWKKGSHFCIFHSVPILGEHTISTQSSCRSLNWIAVNNFTIKILGA